MALLQTPKFNANQLNDFDIDLPGSGGINLKDLKFELDPKQSPNMLNMIYRNGCLCKRNGQEHWLTLKKELTDGYIPCYINDVGYFDDEVYLVTQGGLYSGAMDDNKELRYESNLSTTLSKKNTLFCFNRKIYYYESPSKFYYHDIVVKPGTDIWNEVKPYVPDICINRKPDGTYSDPIEEYNRMGSAFKNTFHGDGTSMTYQLTDKNLDSKEPIVIVNGEVAHNYKYFAEDGQVIFDSAPSKGTNNVEITAYKTVTEEYISGKYYQAYGGANNSRLFIGGCGNGMIYYSSVSDATYFPYSNYMLVGNSAEDVVGFGEQYDVLVVFKPKEIIGVEYYLDNEGKGQFSSKVINSRIGCDAPKSIQLVDNKLVWLSSSNGVCTLVSTEIEDERNVRIISRNIEKGYETTGLLQESNLTDAVSVDWDGKYMLAVNGKVYVWDYMVTPYANTGKLDYDAKRLAWFIYDNITAHHFIKTKDILYLAKNYEIIKMIDEFNDFGEPIKAHYQTPYLQFSAVPYLKTVKNIYVQTLADRAVQIDMTYFTEESPDGEKEAEPIRVYDKLWHSFKWNTFGWQFTNIANTFRRKCSLKKIQMCSVLFENNETDKDMAIYHVGFQYMIVKNIK